MPSVFGLPAAAAAAAVCCLALPACAYAPNMPMRARAVACRAVCTIMPDEKASGVPNVIPQTKLWVEKFIVGLNLCPFAKQPLKEGSIRYAISDARDRDALASDCFAEFAFLLDSERSEVSTTLLLAPAFGEGLQAWGDFGYWVEDFLEEDDMLYDGRIGVAFFHPNWTFEELAAQDPTHFERRAPYPTVSILRREDIGVIVQEFLAKDIIISQKVQEDNARTLAGKGFRALSKALKQIRSAGVQGASRLRVATGDGDVQARGEDRGGGS